MVDFIGDFLTVIRNASRARKDKATIPTSNLTMRIAEILKREGFIDAYKLIEEGPKRSLRVHLRYHRGKEPAIRSLVRISRPPRSGRGRAGRTHPRRWWARGSCSRPR